MARRPRSADDTLKSGPQRLLALVRSSIPPVHRGGLPFISAGVAVAALGRHHRWARRAGLFAAGANAVFFRHPARTPPTRIGVVVAPADGLVCLVDMTPPPPEAGLGSAPVARISIFLSLLDAHVQRIPVGGEVLAVAHRPGRFHSAELPAASEENERTSVVIRTPEGQHVVVVQIAGLIARRIVCDLNVGDHVGIGDTYGLIRYGSRLDTYLPAGSEVLIESGQRALAGETVLARLP
ncbi:MAG: phosphatidylserine decarboxylase [Mycobacteriaceae bacterium]